MDFLGLHGVAAAILTLALVVSLGLALGHVRVAGVSLGVGGVLFVGLAFGHLGLGLRPDLLDFVRDFGLILFVYAIGMQVGHGFLGNLRKDGLRMNFLAAAVVLLGTSIAMLLAFLGVLEVPVAVGLLSGAVTNTPSLGAAQQALSGLPSVPREASQWTGMAYAVAYPFGIVGIIGTLLVLRRLFRVDVKREVDRFRRARSDGAEPLVTRNIEITNPNLGGRTVNEALELAGGGLTASRLFREGTQELAVHDAPLKTGDVIHVIGTADRVDRFRTIAGRYSDLDLPRLPSAIFIRRVVVTRTSIVDRTLEDLALEDRYGVIVTRVIRSGLEFTPPPGLRIQFGDRLLLVGTEATTAQAARELGDSVQSLDRPHIIPVFFGIALGVLVGSIPLSLPGVPAPVRLGLAGGPLLVAIALSRFGRIGPFLSYVPNPAKKLLADLGIALFLGCVGLRSGERFWEVLSSGQGWAWMGWGALITLVPIVVVGVASRALWGLDFVSLCGLLSGSMTDPPALAYATDLVGDDSASMAYATVYPMTMLLRVLLAQVMVLVFLGGHG